MKPMPAAYRELLEKEKQELLDTSTQAEVIQKCRIQEEKNLYVKIKDALAGYHDVEIDGYHLTIKNVPIVNTVELYIDKKHWMTFRVERNFSSCHCENVCDCEVSTWVGIKAVQHKRNGSDYVAYFSVGDGELHDATKVAHAMKKVMHEFKWY